MTTIPHPAPVLAPSMVAPAIRRFSVAEYHQMIQTGILAEDERVELINGIVVHKMPRNPPHDGTILLVEEVLRTHAASWTLRVQMAVTLTDSEPEPDLCLARGPRRSYITRHSGPADVGLVVEVSDSSLAYDQGDKLRLYASAGIPVYWIVNLVDHRVELYTNPSGQGAGAGYTTQQFFLPGTTMPLILDGVTVAPVAVDDLLP
jgi:Uma2 family endonuclease